MILFFMVIAIIPLVSNAQDPPVPPIPIKIRGGWGIEAEIPNDGEVNAYNISWSIHIDGGIIILPSGRTANGIIPCLPPGGMSIRICVFGFGITSIRVSAWTQEGDSIHDFAIGYVFGPFVLVRQ
jgi:hypothetical protein